MSDSDFDRAERAQRLVRDLRNARSTASPASGSVDGEDVSSRCLRDVLALLAWAGPQVLEPPKPQPTTGDDPPSRIDSFEIVRELGRGGFGVVYLARDPNLGRLVAIKIPLPRGSWSAELRQRFLREARIAARLKHENIVRVLSTEEVGDFCCIVYDYCEGPSLKEFLSVQSVLPSVRWSAEVVQLLARAVTGAHEHRVQHRDIKPGNVLLERFDRPSPHGTQTPPHVVPRLTDFGLAKLLGDGGDTASTMGLAGTVRYMSPEQAEGRMSDVGPPADIHALGVILYELLAGRAPFQGESDIQVLRAIAESDPVPLSSLRPEVPRDIEAICFKCLAKLPRHRYESAAALAADLGRFLNGRPTLARPLSPVGRATRFARRSPAITAFMGLAVFALVSAGVGAWWHVSSLDKALAIAQSARIDAEANERRWRQGLYLSELRYAAEALDTGDVRQAIERLEGQIPDDSRFDLRGIVWRHFWSRAHGQRRAIHEGGPAMLCAAPLTDQRSWATGNADGHVQIWDGSANRPRLDFVAHVGDVNSVIPWRAKDWLITAGDDGKVHAWDPRSGSLMHTWHSMSGPISSIAVIETSSRVIAAGRSPTVWILAPDQSEPAGSMLGHMAEVNAISVSPSEEWVATASTDKTVRVWNARDGSHHVSLEGPRGSVTGVGFLDETRIVASTVDGELLVWNLPEAIPAMRIAAHQERIDALAVSPPKRLLVTAAKDGVTKLWSAPEVAFRKAFRAQDGRVHGLAWLDNGSRLISVGEGGNCSSFAILDDAMGDLLAASADPRRVPLAIAGGRAAYVRSLEFVDVIRLDRADSEPALSIKLEKVTALDLSHDCTQLALGAFDGRIELWNTARQQRSSVPSLGGAPITSIRFSKTGDRLVWTEGRLSSRVVIRRLDASETKYELPIVETALFELAISPDGRWTAATGCNPREATIVWPLDGGDEPLARLEGIGGKGIDISEDGKWLAVGEDSGDVILCETSTWTIVASARFPAPIHVVKFSPREPLLLVGSNSSDIRVLGLPQLVPVAKIRALEHPVTSMAVSPDGKGILLVASYGEDRTPGGVAPEVRLWRAGED